MNSPNAPKSFTRHHPASSHRIGPSASHGTPAFHDTLPMDTRAWAKRDGTPPQAPTIAGLLSTYLVAYLVVFVVTLAVLLLTTDLTLALDVVQLVAREALWFTPIVGTVLVIAPWRMASRRRPGA